jgi:hypothetical protein
MLLPSPTTIDYEWWLTDQDYRKKVLKLNYRFVVIPDLIRDPGFSLDRLDSRLRGNDSNLMIPQTLFCGD